MKFLNIKTQQTELFQAMARPEVYPHLVTKVEQRETKKATSGPRNSSKISTPCCHQMNRQRDDPLCLIIHGKNKPKNSVKLFHSTPYNVGDLYPFYE